MARLVRPRPRTKCDLSAHAPEKEGVKERIVWQLERVEATASRRMNRGTGLLASIGATGPFVGLFGTVWGIMNSFVDISRAQTTNLAVVAPGIAEALLATAFGLVAAIPAVMIYNIFARFDRRLSAELGDLSAQVLRMPRARSTVPMLAVAPRGDRVRCCCEAPRSSPCDSASDLDDDALAETHEINVTPFIDVMLVLLIIFMVAAPLATVDVTVDLPSSMRRTDAEAREAGLPDA